MSHSEEPSPIEVTSRRAASTASVPPCRAGAEIQTPQVPRGSIDRQPRDVAVSNREVRRGAVRGEPPITIKPRYALGFEIGVKTGGHVCHHLIRFGWNGGPDGHIDDDDATAARPYRRRVLTGPVSHCLPQGRDRVDAAVRPRRSRGGHACALSGPASRSAATSGARQDQLPSLQAGDGDRTRTKSLDDPCVPSRPFAWSPARLYKTGNSRRRRPGETR